MIINWPQPEKWHELNEKIHQRLGLPVDVTVRSYQGLPHAIFEIAQGTASFLSHKRAVGLLTGNTPFVSGLLPFLYKESFEVQLQSGLAPIETLLTWLDQLKKDTSFVLMSNVNPLTGQLQDLNHFDEVLNQKKIHSFQITLQIPSYEIRPTSVHIVSLSERYSIAICGSKFKSPAQFSPQLVFPEDLFLIDLENFLQQQTLQDLNLIENFESQLPAGFSALLKSKLRLGDRAVIAHPEINADALRQNLLSKLKLSNADLWPLTSCAQSWTDWAWWEDRPSDELMRGLLVLSLTACADKNLPPALKAAVSECQI